MSQEYLSRWPGQLTIAPGPGTVGHRYGMVVCGLGYKYPAAFGVFSLPFFFLSPPIPLIYNVDPRSTISLLRASFSVFLSLRRGCAAGFLEENTAGAEI